MAVQNNFIINRRNVLHENVIGGNLDAVKTSIQNDINIYKRTTENETPLHLALLNGHHAIATILWSIYETDLKFIEDSLQDDDKFWTKKPILIVFGEEKLSSFTELYVEYQNCETQSCIVRDNKCVLFLLKRDNYTPVKLLSLSPKSDTGKALTLRLIQCALSNSVIDLHARTDYGWSLINSTAKSGATNIFQGLIKFGVESNHIDIVLYAIQNGHAEYLDQFYKKFPTNMYEFFISYCLRILGSNNWDVFKLYAEKMMEEKQMTWTQIANYRLPFRNYTVFHYTISQDLIEIAVHLAEHNPNLNVKDISGHSPLQDLKFDYKNPMPYQRLLMKIVEIDPAYLKFIDVDKYTLCHKLVFATPLSELVPFFIKYPDAKQIFYENEEIVLNVIRKKIEEGHHVTIKYLLENAIVPFNNDVLYSILNELARHNDLELFVYVMSLAEFDFTKPCRTENKTEYPLVVALDHQHLEIFNLIWPKVKNSDNLTDLFHGLLRCSIENPEMNELFDDVLEKCHDVNCLSDENGHCLFSYAARSDNLHAAKELIKRNLKIELDYCESDVLLPSHYAKNVEMYELLINHTNEDDKDNQSCENGFTQLHTCVSRESNDSTLKLIEYLIENGGDIEEEDAQGRTPIYYARDANIAQCLLKYNPNVNVNVDEDENTPIHYAFKTNRPNAAYSLLDHESVDYTKRNKDDWSYLRCLVTEQYDYGDLEQVLSNTNSKFRSYLLDHCNDSIGNGTPFILEVLKGNAILSNVLLEMPNLDIFVQNPYNRSTPLHVAVRYGRADIVDFLIEHGLQINEQNVDGNTPLNLYCGLNVDICEEFLRRVLRHNPEVCAKNERGMSPILYVASKDKTGEAVCELLAHGSSLIDTDPNGERAYDKLAVELQEVFKFLIDN